MNFSASTGTGRRAALSFGQFFFCSQQVVSILAGLQGLYRYLMGTCGSTSLVSHTASSMYLLYLPNNHDLLSILYRVLCCVTQGTMRRRRSFGQHQTSALHPKWKRASFIEREVLTSTDRDTVLLNVHYCFPVVASCVASDSFATTRTQCPPQYSMGWSRQEELIQQASSKDLDYSTL